MIAKKVLNLLLILLVFFAEEGMADARLVWGSAKPVIVQCEGKKFHYSVALDNLDLTYKDTFCAEQHAKTADQCASKESVTEQTQRCYKKMLHAPSKISATQAVCSWGSTGARMIVCEGQRFGYGSVDCTDNHGNVKLYQNVFCREKLLNSGKDCANDPAPATKSCYAKLVKEQETAIPDIFEDLNLDSEKYQESLPKGNRDNQ